MTFFGKCDPKFQPIPEDKQVLTGLFLEASRKLLPFFDYFNGFGMVKKDVSGNIDKMNEKYIQNPEKYRTVNDILNETEPPKDDKESKRILKDAHIGAIWLTRGLDFIQQMIVEIVEDYEAKNEPEGNTSGLVQKAYEKTLMKHHNFVVKNLVKPLCKLAPTKPVLLSKLKDSDDIASDQVIADMKDYHSLMKQNADVIQAAILARGLDD